MSAFEDFLAQRLLINKFIEATVVPPGADPQTGRIAVDRWLQDISGKASVRISLSEQGPGSGCGCCDKSNEQIRQQARHGQGCVHGNRANPDQEKAAADAALRYWRAKYGPDEVAAQLKDFGCHVQVDVVKNDTIIGSLRYQDGTITEL